MEEALRELSAAQEAQRLTGARLWIDLFSQRGGFGKPLARAEAVDLRLSSLCHRILLPTGPSTRPDTTAIPQGLVTAIDRLLLAEA